MLIIDWECSSRCAPVLTDFIGYWISYNFKEIRSHDDETFKEFVNRFNFLGLSNALYGLIYLSFITGSEEALILLKTFIGEKEY